MTPAFIASHTHDDTIRVGRADTSIVSTSALRGRIQHLRIYSTALAKPYLVIKTPNFDLDYNSNLLSYYPLLDPNYINSLIETKNFGTTDISYLYT